MTNLFAWPNGRVNLLYDPGHLLCHIHGVVRRPDILEIKKVSMDMITIAGQSLNCGKGQFGRLGKL